MSRRKPVVHLVCNAHLDPIWMWQWEEGAREAISTFRTAADLLEEYPEFVFNHNESLLYEWVEEHDPILFTRIQEFVKAGRWNISGGWYLQPDCNIPGGETFVRLITTGRRYFAEKFGVRPPVAYNFDSFGHNWGLPQLLHQSGYEFYLHCRPAAEMLTLPGITYRWQGADGTQALAHRSVSWYGTGGDGHCRGPLEKGIERARESGEDALVLWGVGDHGGGPTRMDLEIIRKMRAETADVEVRHSTPEAFLASLKPAQEYPVHKSDMQRAFAGCYTSVSPIKRGMRRGEALLASAERWSTLAWWTRGRKYPKAELREAWKGVLLNTFHDILGGTSLESAVEQDIMAIYARSADMCRRLRFTAQHALLPNVSPKPGTIPVYVFNPHASKMAAPLSLDFITAKWELPERPPFALYDDSGHKIPSQDAKITELVSSPWHRRVSFLAEVPALSVRRYEIKPYEEQATSASPLTVSETEEGITVENRWLQAKFLRATGGLASLLDKRTGQELLRDSARLVAMKDRLDAWGGRDNVDFSAPAGKFTPLSAKELGRWVGDETSDCQALHVLFQGSVSITIQSLVGWRHSRAVQQFTLYADSPYVEVKLRVHWQERRKCLKWVLPFRFKKAQPVCEVPFAAIERPADGTEYVGGRWVRLEETKGAGLAVGVANDGQYGLHARKNGELGLSLLRGAIHSFYGDTTKIRADEHHTYIDQGQHDYRFRIVWGEAAELASALIPAAMELNLPLEAFFVFHQPTPSPDTPTKVESPLEIAPNTIVLSALKRAFDGDDLILRCSETAGRPTAATIKFTGLASPVALDFRPYEIKTLRVKRTAGGLEITPCNLLEENEQV